MSENKRFAQVMAALAETFQRDVTESLAKIYREALGDLSIGQIEKAAAEHIALGQHFPRPVELRKLVVGSEEDRALAAWIRANALRSSVGSYRPMPAELDESSRKAIAALGGWREFCVSEEPEHFLRQRFVDSWGLYDREQRTALPAGAERLRLVE